MGALAVPCKPHHTFFPLQYVNPSNPGSASIDQFWSDPNARQRLKDYMYYVANRVNTFTGRAYKDEPSIFGYNLYNELRCPAAQNQDETQLNSACSLLTMLC